MDLSIIIPCYNKEQYLDSCVRSVLEQTLVPDEIIIVDDCSKDKSREIILELTKQDSRIKPIFQTENKGVSAARNRGVAESKSKYVTMLDADDILINPRKLENEMELIRKNDKKPRTVVYSLTQVIDAQGNRLEQQVYQKEDMAIGENTRAGLLSGKYLNQYIPRDYCVEKDFLLSCGGFNESMNYYEDLDLLLRMSKEANFVCTLQPGTGYRQLDNGLSSQSLKRHKMTMKEFKDTYWSDLLISEKIVFHIDRIQGKLKRGVRKIIRCGVDNDV